LGKSPNGRLSAFAGRFSFSDLLAAVFEFFISPNKSSWGRDGKGLCMGYHGRGRTGSFGLVPGLRG
jgi:hypothetical protein